MITLRQAKTLHESGVPFIFFDTETTGLTPGAIVEIAAKKVVQGKIVGDFHRLVNTGMRLDSETIKIHGITMEMIEAEGKPAKEVLEDFYHWVGDDAVLTAHNLPFDMTFLNAHNQRDNLKMPKVYECCTLELIKAMDVEPENNKLKTLAKYYKIDLDDKQLHRAMYDVTVLAEVFLKMVDWETTKNQVSDNLFVSQSNLQSEENGNDEAIKKIKQDCKFCAKCDLRKGAKQVVTGDGGYRKRIMIIGEAPGEDEDTNGVPFCGRSGKFLAEMLANAGLCRDDVYITNIVKCRPPANRDPEDNEKAICSSSWLDREIEILKPKIIILLGRHSMGHFFPNVIISEIKAKIFRRVIDGQLFLPLYHPAVALYGSSKRDELMQDFLKIKEVVG